MKKGFLVYFDNCAQTIPLPDGTFAPLWKTIFGYAQRLAEDRDAEAWLEEQTAGLPPESVMALRFITDNVRRDHLRYQDRTAQYRAARQQQTDRQTGFGGQKGSGHRGWNGDHASINAEIYEKYL